MKRNIAAALALLCFAAAAGLAWLAPSYNGTWLLAFPLIGAGILLALYVRDLDS